MLVSPLQGFGVMNVPVTQGGASLCPGLSCLSPSGWRAVCFQPAGLAHISPGQSAAPPWVSLHARQKTALTGRVQKKWVPPGRSTFFRNSANSLVVGMHQASDIVRDHGSVGHVATDSFQRQ